MNSLFTNDFLSTDAANNIHIPTKADLYEALENILWFWPGMFVQQVRDSHKLTSFDLCRTVRLTGQYEGLVIMKTSQSLGWALAQSLLHEQPISPDDAFNEFANMFCGHIMNKIRLSDKVVFRHFLPAPALEESQPFRTPEARITVAIETIILDVQLWISQHPVKMDEI